MIVNQKVATTNKTMSQLPMSQSAAQASLQINGIFSNATNAFSGINGGQPSVTSTGQVSVPTAQSGSGIFNELWNVAAPWLKNKYLSPVPPQVVSTPAASVGGNTQLTQTLPGGITVIIPDTNRPPVTTNTTEQSGSGWRMSTGWWVLPLALVAAFFFLPMLLKRRR